MAGILDIFYADIAYGSSATFRRWRRALIAEILDQRGEEEGANRRGNLPC